MGTKPIVAICGSAKFCRIVEALAAQLVNCGIDVRTPAFGDVKESRVLTPAEKHELTLSFL